MTSFIAKNILRAALKAGVHTAVFDVDHTLVDGNTARLFAAHLRRRGLLKFGDIWDIPCFAALYHWGLLDYRVVVRRALKAWRGKTVSELVEEGRMCVDGDIRPRLRTPLVELLCDLREQQVVPVLMSASPHELLRHLAADLGVELLATRLSVADDRFTGEVEGERCYGAGKVRLLNEHLDRRGLERGRTLVLGDSISDRPLLETARLPVAVAPDPRLRSWARRNAILLWDI